MSFVKRMFNAIVESVLDNDNEKGPDFDDSIAQNQEYQDYLKKHNLEMCSSKEILEFYLKYHDYVVLDVKGHLIPAVITLKQVTIM